MKRLALAFVLLTAGPALAQSALPAQEEVPPTFRAHEVDMTAPIMGIDGKPLPDQAQGVQVPADPGTRRPRRPGRPRQHRSIARSAARSRWPEPSRRSVARQSRLTSRRPARSRRRRWR